MTTPTLNLCAWCDRAIGAVPDDPAAMVSHGICGACMAHFLKDFEEEKPVVFSGQVEATR